MIEQEPIDLTRLAPPPRMERRWSDTRLSSPYSPSGELLHSGSTFLTYTPSPLYASREPISGASSAVLAPLTVAVPGRSAIDRTRDDRVRLLAKKYATGDVSREEFARIEILTARLETLAPRTTAEDIDRLAQVVDTIERLKAGLQDFDAEFGL